MAQAIGVIGKTPWIGGRPSGASRAVTRHTATMIKSYWVFLDTRYPWPGRVIECGLSSRVWVTMRGIVKEVREVELGERMMIMFTAILARD